MKEIIGNIWDMKADIICITTNGNVKSNGDAVMGRGIALQCAKRYPHIPSFLGKSIGKNGNCVVPLDTAVLPHIFSFPTKLNWWEKSDIELIKKSCHELKSWMDQQGYKKVLLPRPGCANGGLNWADVKKAIAPILDDRVTVVSL